MAEKAFLTGQNTAIFACSKCNRQFVKDVSQYLKIPSEVKLKVKCTCGHSWVAILEKRRYFRKTVNLTGSYICRSEGKESVSGNMTVVDISTKGLKIKLKESHTVELNDLLDVEFRLDNRTRTLIKRTVSVKNISGPYIGVAFSDYKHEDPDIGFYLK